MGVKEYDKWTLETSVDEIDKYNASSLNDKEIELIKKIHPQKVFDVGSRNGKRLFSYLDVLGIDYIGIEKFEKLVEFGNNKYSDKIIVGDILDVNLKNLGKELLNIDTITILGGSLNGIFGFDQHFKAWQIIKNILLPTGQIIFEAKMVVGFENLLEIGEITFNKKLPPQFHLSEKQLYDIWDNLNLTVVEYSDYQIPNWYKARYYIIKNLSSCLQ